MAACLNIVGRVSSPIAAIGSMNSLISNHCIAVIRHQSTKSTDESNNAINNCPDSCLCSNNIKFDYKNSRLLSQFVSSQTGRMFPRTYTKICMKKQKELAQAIKRSRTMGFMPYVSKDPEYLNDPNLFI